MLTWFGTLEQVDYGLYNTIQKYFTWKSFLVIPEINGKIVPLPMVGAYWVSALLFFNMFLGGILKIRKGWKQVGIMVSHFGILLLIAGGFVTHHFSKRGNMALYEGESADYAQAYHDHVIEIAELDEQGMAKKVHFIDTPELNKVKKRKNATRLYELSNLPFDFQISNYHDNCRPARVGPFRVGTSKAIDGFALFHKEKELEDEANLNGCEVIAFDKEGKQINEFLLFGAEFQPLVIEYQGTHYSVILRKKLWKMPFLVNLKDFTAEFFPGTARPKKFESEITRTESGNSSDVRIWMNNPMRYKGYTFFQASWGPQEGAPDRRLFSVFEIVKNPADQWPLYSILVTSAGLLGHFGIMLGRHIFRQTKS